MVDTPKIITTMTKRIQLRVNLLRNSKNGGVLVAALSHVVPKTAILAPEKIILRTMPKTMKTLLRSHPSRRIKNTGKIAPTNRPGPMTRRTVVIIRSLRMRKALATKISSCLRNLSNRSASSDS